MKHGWKKVIIGNKELEISGELHTILSCGCEKVYDDEFPRPVVGESVYCTTHNVHVDTIRNEVRSNAKGRKK